MRILLVEDDYDLGEATKKGLENLNITVDWLTDGQQGLRAVLNEGKEGFDVIVLDRGLPKKEGLEVLKEIRQKKIKTPVLILTAKDTTHDSITGLDAGADDYMGKPFDLGELSARIRALHRRSTSAGPTPHIVVGNVKLDPISHVVYENESPITLSRREFALLRKLMENTGRVISRDKLSQSLYGWGDDIDSNALEVHVHNLRKKFSTVIIKTIRGVGYMMINPENLNK